MQDKPWHSSKMHRRPAVAAAMFWCGEYLHDMMLQATQDLVRNLVEMAAMCRCCEGLDDRRHIEMIDLVRELVKIVTPQRVERSLSMLLDTWLPQVHRRSEVERGSPSGWKTRQEAQRWVLVGGFCSSGKENSFCGRK